MIRPAITDESLGQQNITKQISNINNIFNQTKMMSVKSLLSNSLLVR